MPAIDPLVLDIQLRYRDMERNARNASRLFTTEADRMQRASADLTRRLERDGASIASTLRGMAGSFAAYFGTRELAGLIDSYTRLQNSLRVAGLEGQALEGVQSKLFATAQKYGVALGGLTELYGSLSQSGKDLGATQGDILKLTTAVSAGLKITGVSAAQAAGATLGLTQALSNGKLQAEEFNQINEGGLRPLLQAAAASERFGGSIGRLRAAVLEGKVTSQEFFALLVKGSEDIERTASRAADTIAGGYTRITNALTIYVGESAKANGATQALVGAMNLLADNIDVIIPALGILGAALGVGLVTNAVKARGSIAGVGAGLYAAFGGGAGLAITGVTLALGSFAAEAAETSRLVEQAKQANDRYQESLQAAQAVAQGAASGQAAVGDQSAAAVPKIDAFAGATGRAAQKLYELAAAQKAAALQGLLSKKAANDELLNSLSARSAQGRNAAAADFRRGDFLGNLGIIRNAVVNGGMNVLTRGRSDAKIDTAIQQTIAERDRIARQIAEVQGRPLASYAPAPVTAGAPRGAGAGRATGGARASGGAGAASGGMTAQQRANEQERIEQEIASARIAYLREMEGSTANAEERARLEQQAIEATRVANNRQIETDERFSAAQRAKLQGLNDRIAESQKAEASRREAERVRTMQVAITQDALRDEDAMLQVQARLASTLEERRRIELRRLALAYDIERSAIAEELNAATITGDTARIAAATKRMADLKDRQATDTRATERDNAGPLARFRQGLGDPATDVEDAVAQKLQDVDDAIADAAAKTLGIRDPFLRRLLQVFLEQNVLRPLYDAASGGGGLLGGLAGLARSVFGGSAGVPGFATGGSMLIGGRGGVDRNLLSLNGQPLARVSKGETLNIANAATGLARPATARQPVVLKVYAEEGAMFVPRVEQISGNTAVQVVRAATPTLVRASSARTRSDAQRDANLKL